MKGAINVDSILETMAKRASTKKREPKGCYKGGIEFEGEWYPTKKALWEAKGKVKFNTFKTRLHRGYPLEVALGYTTNGRNGNVAEDDG